MFGLSSFFFSNESPFLHNHKNEKYLLKVGIWFHRFHVLRFYNEMCILIEDFQNIKFPTCEWLSI